MAPAVVDFLIEQSAVASVWGQSDCALLIADWWMAVHGVDPAAHLRGTYSTRRGCARLVKRSGGLVQLVDGIAAGVGAKRNSGNKPGDFGVAIIAGAPRGFIQSGRFMAVRNEQGIAFCSGEILTGWSV